ncbi:MAG: cellulase family glycosylhydrolase, partial [Planctomycetales bacterium]|nr:cellulase family glycosylhydrolase [Planctomycetales bacterium]
MLGQVLCLLFLVSGNTAIAQTNPETSTDRPLEWIRVSDDGMHFVGRDSGRKVVLWGANYDHDDAGQLLEDYWHEHWETVVQDFQEMKALNLNVVRIHLQLAKFMDAADRPNMRNLQQLQRLVAMAEKTGLYLDVTGLGCYHKQDVPQWYDDLAEADRWNVQARFWREVANVCKTSPAVFCYDLMNEPVVAGGDKKRDDWLGPGFGGKHFVQYITLDRAGRERPEIARKWVQTLVKAIRKHDQRHLVTVGLVPWSLDRPGLTSGFVPEKVADDLDFVAVHIYPEKGKVDEAIETL